MIDTPVAEASGPESAAASGHWLLRLRFQESQLQADGVGWVDRGPIAAFVDGLIFDREEIAALGDEAVTNSDSALIAAAFARVGEALIPRLRGSFVAAIIDRARRCAFVVRDPLGMHPLYHAESGGAVLFASSIDRLLRSPGVSGDLNRAAIADYLCRRMPFIEETYFAAVRRVPPGSLVRVEKAGATVERYWNLQHDFEWSTESEAQRFTEHLDRAVRRCSAAGPVGVFLSGGFDSVSVAAVATDLAQRSGRPVPRALSLGFPHPDCDERNVQTAVANQLGLPLLLMDFHEAASPRGLIAEAVNLNEQLDGPLLNSWMPAYLALVERARAEGVRTIITGEGGDEWLGVSLYLTADLLKRGDFRGVVRFMRTVRRSFDSSWMRIARETLWTCGLRPLASAALSRIAPEAWERSRSTRRVSADPAWVAPDPALRAEQRHRAARHLGAARPPGSFYEQDSRHLLGHPVMTGVFEEQHHFGSRLGVRYLHPYWDADLLDHLSRIPPEILNQGDRAKGLVREALGRRFPGLGFETQRKVMASTFYASMVRAEAPAQLRRYADFSGLARLGIVDPGKVRAYVERALGDESPRVLSSAWNVVNMESWVLAQRRRRAA